MIDESVTESVEHPITLPIFSQLLEPEGIAPAQDFAESGKLLCNSLPTIQLRSQIRFIVGGSLEFVLSEDTEVRRMLKHWRAELSPQIEGSDEDIFVLLSAWAGVSLVGHYSYLGARAICAASGH